MGARDRIARLIAEGIHAYHGSTERSLKVLDPRRGIETPGATFHASNPDVAYTFTVPREYGEPMFYDARGREIKPGNVYETLLTPKRMLELPPRDAQRFIDDTAYQSGVVREAKQAGHDALVARNVLEGIGERYPGDVYAQFDPSIARIIGKYGAMGGLASQADYGTPQWPTP